MFGSKIEEKRIPVPSYSNTDPPPADMETLEEKLSLERLVDIVAWLKATRDPQTHGFLFQKYNGVPQDKNKFKPTFPIFMQKYSSLYRSATKSDESDNQFWNNFFELQTFMRLMDEYPDKRKTIESIYSTQMSLRHNSNVFTQNQQKIQRFQLANLTRELEAHISMCKSKEDRLRKRKRKTQILKDKKNYTESTPSNSESEE